VLAASCSQQKTLGYRRFLYTAERASAMYPLSRVQASTTRCAPTHVYNRRSSDGTCLESPHRQAPPYWWPALSVAWSRQPPHWWSACTLILRTTIGHGQPHSYVHADCRRSLLEGDQNISGYQIILGLFSSGVIMAVRMNSVAMVADMEPRH
jgi:hypothetical protein